MSLDKTCQAVGASLRRSLTFRRVHGAEADRLIRRGWLRVGSYTAEDYDSHCMMKRDRDDAPAGEDSHGGE